LLRSHGLYIYTCIGTENERERGMLSAAFILYIGYGRTEQSGRH